MKSQNLNLILLIAIFVSVFTLALLVIYCNYQKSELISSSFYNSTNVSNSSKRTHDIVEKKQKGGILQKARKAFTGKDKTKYSLSENKSSANHSSISSHGSPQNNFNLHQGIYGQNNNFHSNGVRSFGSRYANSRYASSGSSPMFTTFRS